MDTKLETVDTAKGIPKVTPHSLTIRLHRSFKNRHKSYCCEIVFFQKPLNIKLLYELIVLGIEIAP